MEITFTHNRKQYTGDLSIVQGAGSTGVYHLMINNYYKGRLRLSAFDNRWVFDGEFAPHCPSWLEEWEFFYQMVFETLGKHMGAIAAPK